MHDGFTQIFENGSRTFYTSSFFFPKKIRADIVRLYAFVRVADDFIDRKNPQRQEFNAFVKSYHDGLAGKKISSPIISSFIDLSRRHEFDPAWTEDFFKAMASDLNFKKFKTLDEVVDKYIYGSAEVVGLMLCKIFRLSPASFKYASLLGRAFQYINFIRDVSEDNALNRTYFPIEILKKYGLPDLKERTVRKNPEAFKQFIDDQIRQYRLWQHEAEKGYKFMPKSALIAVKTAADMYEWTAAKICKHPLLIYKVKLKPSRNRILFTGFKNYLKVNLGI